MNNELPKTVRPDDICPRPDKPVAHTTQPMAPAIYPTSVWMCNDTQQADQLLAGELEGYVYQRVGHPNADAFADKVAALHAAERVAVTSSGMAALSLAVLSQLEPGDHIVVSNQLYGQSLLLLTQELNRFGINSTRVDTCDLGATRAATTSATKLLVVETIGNPCLHVADIRSLAEIADQHKAKLLVDNTFATPVLCRPLELGADLVMESVSKLMNGHSDVMLGALCGLDSDWERVPRVLSAWGFASSPFDAWLALRGLATMPLRVERACSTAQRVAEFLTQAASVEHVDYPGLPDHPQHVLAASQFDGRFGSIVTFRLSGGRPAADAFIAATDRIPFCPSLGEAATTLSHPESTSHRGLSTSEREALGISGGTIRLSVGLESTDFVIDALTDALAPSNR
ncbi:MAG: aminotransferase class I/II-fold pyridoxal phosphate-dependent enzyme [Planctomycetota bacterium]|nr:aminotransferase class I/II-fold pyridoxal phosphate-dependent enzyme [Planctomycetota bacterium]